MALLKDLAGYVHPLFVQSKLKSFRSVFHFFGNNRKLWKFFLDPDVWKKVRWSLQGASRPHHQICKGMSIRKPLESTNCLYKPDAWQDRGLCFDTDLLSLSEYAFLATDGENSYTSCPSKWMTNLELEHACHSLLHCLRKKLTEAQVTKAILERRETLKQMSNENLLRIT